MRARHLIAALAVLVGAPASSAASSAAAGASTASPTRTLSGSCSFSGPITPNPPITVVPKPGPHFSFAGNGTCTGTAAGAAITNAPLTLTFTNVQTAFDTCEFGPDYNLPGVLTVASTRFDVTVNLTRIALAGPFTVITPGGGKGSGTAQFTPANNAQAIQQCGTSGIGAATLSGHFTTSAPLVGTAIVPAPARHRKARRHRAKRRRHRHR